MSFDYVPGVPLEGMMAGEDRHFCIRAESLHLEMVADAWPDIFHIYHPAQAQRIPDMLTRLGQVHHGFPEPDGLVSLVLEAVEPFQQSGQYFMLPPQHIRGRIGALGLVPELELAVRDMRRGDVRTVPVHFPQHYEIADLRGQRRLVKVTLVDCKPYGFPPVVEDELLAGPGIWMDPTQYTERQMVAINSEAAV